MRYLFSVISVLTLCVMAQATHAGENLSSPIQIGLQGGFSDAPGYASRAPQASLSLEGGTQMFRLHVTGSGILVHKTYTPGGYQIGVAGGMEFRLHGITMIGGMTSSHTDQKAWTKGVRYAYAGAGYRWESSADEKGVLKSAQVARFTYYWETYSTYPNNTKVYDLSYDYYHRIGHSPIYFRASAILGVMAYNDGPLETDDGLQLHPGHHTGLRSRFGLGLAWMKY